MDIAAGIFLILAAVLNVFAAMAYNTKGSLNSGFSNIGDNVDKSLNNGESSNSFSGYRLTGILNKLFAFFLYLSIPTLIIGAVFLFKGTNPIFIVIAGGVAIFAEIVGGIMTKYGPANASGLIGGILALVIAIPLISA